MRRRARVALATALGAAALVAGARAAGQEQPESLLPPGFGQPAPPRPRPAAPAGPSQAPAAAPAVSAAGAASPPPASPVDIPATDAPLLPLDLPILKPPVEIPDAARRSPDLVGAADIYGQDAFGDADGRYLAVLMRRIQTPIASRWAEIVLRRVLLTPTPQPRGTCAADWVADRAALLLRLGEADGARVLVQAVDVEDFSPRLRAAAIQASLATSDPGGLCPLPSGSESVGGQPLWPMARAMCAMLAGDGATANATIGRGAPNDAIDHPLAEKLVAAGGGGRRDVPVDWSAVDTLTDWRFGLATALNVVIPQALLDAAPVWFQAWLARAPMLAAADRIAPAKVAAALGPFSNIDLVDLYGRAMDEAGSEDRESPPGLLRAAYVGDDDDARLSAMHALWDAAGNGQGGERDRYAASILTARAAARIVPADDQADDVAGLVASMFSAGLDIQAERWARIAEAANGADGDRAWAMLAVGARRPVVTIDAKRLAKLAGNGDAGPHRAAMLAAALAGLGRMPQAQAGQIMTEQGEPPAGATPYSRALDRAVAASERGTVVLLVAAGMQTPRWGGVPAQDFMAMIGALRAVGLEGEARMIAAEAMARL